MSLYHFIYVKFKNMQNQIPFQGGKDSKTVKHSKER